jgi:hypothetical protein
MLHHAHPKEGLMTPLPSLSTLSLLLLCTPALAQAQNCFRGRPLPTCRTFWITESGVGTRVNPGGPGLNLFATLEIGRMSNRARTAFGGTLLVGVTDQGLDGTDLLLGVKPRFRTWLGGGGSTSLDLSPGVFYVATGGGVGFTGHVAISVGDRLALTGQVLAFRTSTFLATNRTDVGWYAGVKLGSWPGVAAAIVVPAVYCVALCASLWSDER